MFQWFHETIEYVACEAVSKYRVLPSYLMYLYLVKSKFTHQSAANSFLNILLVWRYVSKMPCVLILQDVIHFFKHITWFVSLSQSKGILIPIWNEIMNPRSFSEKNEESLFILETFYETYFVLVNTLGKYHQIDKQVD